MKRTLLLYLLLSSSIFSCQENEVNPKSTQEQEALYLEQLFEEISSMAQSKTCSNSNSWTYTSYGNKACGGPKGFIAYSTEIDTSDFLKKIEAHKVAETEFNRKWQITSDCTVELEPTQVVCESGKAKFKY